ncbi:MAG: DUF2341 domain-containing protein [Candidatus Methanoperedens sp.]|nr:DUF2341 domain-containing protein [Candidatus Methanoperedens sp.]MCZ7368976.1 DUF2341 domain-containing protein [Candidatus Methanoperedens sp.]
MAILCAGLGRGMGMRGAEMMGGNKGSMKLSLKLMISKNYRKIVTKRFPKIIYILFLIFTIILLSSGNAYGYDWPIKNAHPITAVLGEYRTGPPKHLHTGIDIGGAEGTEVYSVETGKVTKVSISADKNSYITIGNFKYQHIKEYIYKDFVEVLSDGSEEEYHIGTSIKIQTDSSHKNDVEIVAANSGLLKKGLPTLYESDKIFYVPITQPIAVTRDYPDSNGNLGTSAGDHLHFEENEGGLNPLRIGGLQSFSDTSKPKINNIEIVEQGSGNALGNSIYGKVDIKADAKDSISGGSQTVGVYKIGYLIQNSNTYQINQDWTYNIEFDKISGYNLDLIYDSGSTSSKYIYWVTNTPYENKFWNTKQKLSGSETDDAQNNQEAKFPDDVYWIWVDARDISGKDDVDNIEKRVDNFPPQIKNTYPDSNEINVPVDADIKITFDEEMDKNSISLSISPNIAGTFSWSNNNRNLVFEPTVELRPATEYTVKVDGKDTVSKSIDGDKNGNEGPSYEFKFKTSTCTIKIDHPFYNIPDGQTQTHHIKVKNEGIPSAKLPITLSTVINNAGQWTVIDGVNGQQVNIPIGQESQEYPIVVTNNGASHDLDMTIKGDANGFSCTYELYDGTPATDHIADHPDDSFIISGSNYPTPWLVDTESSTGILKTGWGEGMGHVLGKYNISTAIVKPDLTILNEPYRELNDLKVLLVGSAGLTGLDSSPTFRKKLADFVDNGGTLVALTSQNGYEFNALPGGEVSGYGWNEDQSCQYQSVSLNTYHSVLSGQESTTPSINIDGYFTKWPNNSKILLTRTKNGMPAMIMYDYGRGHVVASAMYDDWAYGTSGATNDGMNLIRDVVTWAKNPVELVDYAPSDMVNITVNVTNRLDSNVSNVSLRLIDPERKFVGTVNASVFIASWDTVPVNFTYIAPSKLGIYTIDYLLSNESGAMVQEEFDAASFSVSKFKSNPSGFTNQGSKLQIWANAPEKAAKGSEILFRIYVRNDEETEFKGNIAIGGHEQGGLFWRYYTALRDISVPPHSVGEFTYTYDIMLSTSFYFGLYRQGANYENQWFHSGSIASSEKGVWVFNPLVDVELRTDMSQYGKGDEVFIFSDFINKQGSDYNLSANFKILDPDNSIIFENTTDLNLSSYETKSLYFNYSLPNKSKSGFHVINVEVFRNNEKIGYGSTYFEVGSAYLKINISKPEMIVPGAINTFFFNITNIGLGNASDSRLNITLLNPAGNAIFSNSTFLNISINQSVIYSIDVPVNEIDFGKYVLKYSLNQEKLDIKGEIPLQNSDIITLNFDKPSYRIRDDLGAVLSIVNKGLFYQNLSVNISIPDANFSKNESFEIQPGKTLTNDLNLTLPDNLTLGNYPVNVTLALNNTFSKAFTFNIPESNLKASFEVLNVSAGENLSVNIENTGGVDTTVNYTLTLNGNGYYNSTNGSITVLANVSSNVNLPLHSGLKNGNYIFALTYKNSRTGTWDYLKKQVHVNGVEGDVKVSNDRRIYLTDNVIESLSNLTNLNKTNINGTLNLRIYSPDKIVTPIPYSASADIGLNKNFIVQVDNDTLSSGWYYRNFNYHIYMNNIDDSSDTILSGLRFSVRADNITNVGSQQYATWNETSVDWIFPPDQVIQENDGFSTGFDVNYPESKYLNVNMGRWMNQTEFSSTGYQLAMFNVTFEDTDFMWVNGNIWPGVGWGVNASIVPGTFITDAPVRNVVERENNVMIEFDKQRIETGVTYNFSVIIRVEPPNERTVVFYKPSFNIDMGYSHVNVPGGLGFTAEIPSSMLPEHVSSISASTNIFNSWQSIWVNDYEVIGWLNSVARTTTIGTSLPNTDHETVRSTYYGSTSTPTLTAALSNSGGSTWQFYADITINNTGGALSAYQVPVSLNGSSFPTNVQNSGADIRFTDANGAELSYWIESWDYANKRAKIWVNVTSIPASGSTTIRMWYENPVATSSSNGKATFVFFDDFENGNLNDTWVSGDICDGNTITVEQGRVKSTSNCDFIETLQQFSGNLAVTVDVEKVSIANSGCWDFHLKWNGNNAQGALRFDQDGVDGISIGNNCGNEYNIPASNPNKGNITLFAEGGNYKFKYTDLNGVSLVTDDYPASSYLGKLKIDLAGYESAPRYVDNVRIRKYTSHEPTLPGEYSTAEPTYTPLPTPPADVWIQNPANEHYYKIITSMNWSEAEAQAVTWGGHLVTINDREEELWLKNQFGEEDFWIGFNDIQGEGNWEWVSGEPVTYTNWAQGEPNNNGVGENAAVMNWGTDGDSWNDLPEEGNSRGIVERITVPPSTNPNQSYFVWNTTIPVDIPPEGMTIPVSVNIASALNKTTGRLVLEAVLYSNSSQVLSSSNYTFYVFDTNTTISLETDKEVYRPGESVVISGEIKNWADAPTSNLNFVLDADGNELLTETFLLAAGETRSFSSVYSSNTSFNINAGIGDIKISQPVEVEAPLLVVNITSPDVAGRGEFIVAALLENPGKLVINETLDVEGNIYNVSIHGGESKLIETPFIINKNKTINITLLGDVDLTLSRFVIFGENASLKVSPEIYSPGHFEVPYNIENTGSLETEFNANFSLEDKIIEKAVYLPVGGNFSGSLIFNLSEGNYILNYTTPFETGNVSFRVAKMDIAGMNATIPEKAIGNILAVVVNVSNMGANNFTGNIEIDTGFYSNNSLLVLNVSEKRSLILKVPTLIPGVFNATVRLLHNGNIIEEKVGEFEVLGPEFTVTSAPTNLNYRLGENVTMSFGVLNTGGMEGTAGLNLTIPGIYENNNNSWVAPGEVKNLSFSFILPEDLEEKSYKFLYGFNGDMQEGSFFVKGASISVEAALDKPFYNEGDTAVLTLPVKNNQDFDLPLFSRVKFNDYDNITYFKLSGSGSETLTFNVPVHFTGDKIFYSVYMASGRSLYINSMYAYEKPKDDSGITLYTDKQVYLTGETVNVFVNVTGDGTLNMTAPGFSTTRSLTAGDSTVISFTLPELKSGTYYIEYTFGNFSSSYPFDVDGYSAKILEFTLDKEIYDIGDTMNMKMLVDANKDFAGTVKMWVYGNSAEDSFEFSREFVKGENRVEVNRTLNTSWSGIHSVAYGVYADIPGHSLVLLASGEEYFDVVDHVPPLITITSPQNIEYTTSSVPLIFSIEDTSDIEWTGYSLDGAENVTISGSSLLTDLTNGNHRLIVYAMDSAGNTGSASTDFIIGSTLPKEAHAEAVIMFDTASKDINVYNNGTGSEVSYVILPSKKEKNDKKEQDKADDKGWELRQYTLKDISDNSLVLVLKHKTEGKETKIEIVSMQYNSEAIIETAKNTIQAQYSEEKNGMFKELEQKIEVDKLLKAETKYNAKKDETEIKVKMEGEKEQKENRAGNVILELFTENGILKLRY